MVSTKLFALIMTIAMFFHFFHSPSQETNSSINQSIHQSINLWRSTNHRAPLHAGPIPILAPGGSAFPCSCLLSSPLYYQYYLVITLLVESVRFCVTPSYYYLSIYLSIYLFIYLPLNTKKVARVLTTDLGNSQTTILDYSI